MNPSALSWVFAPHQFHLTLLSFQAHVVVIHRYSHETLPQKILVLRTQAPYSLRMLIRSAGFSTSSAFISATYSSIVFLASLGFLMTCIVTGSSSSSLSNSRSRSGRYKAFMISSASFSRASWRSCSPRSSLKTALSLAATLVLLKFRLSKTLSLAVLAVLVCSHRWPVTWSKYRNRFELIHSQQYAD